MQRGPRCVKGWHYACMHGMYTHQKITLLWAVNDFMCHASAGFVPCQKQNIQTTIMTQYRCFTDSQIKLVQTIPRRRQQKEDVFHSVSTPESNLFRQKSVLVFLGLSVESVHREVLILLISGITLFPLYLDWDRFYVLVSEK